MNLRINKILLILLPFLQINILRPVFETSSSQCSRQLRFLICSSLFPWCSDEVLRPVMACRNVCVKVKTECAQDPIMKYWPDFLDCDKLVQPEKQELCMNVSRSNFFKYHKISNMRNYFLDAR